MKEPTQTRSAPPTAAFASAPPEILPTFTEPATTAATFVVELEMKIRSVSRPYFWYMRLSSAMYQLALGASMELYEILSRSCAYLWPQAKTDARHAQPIRIQIRRIPPAFTANRFSDFVIPERFYRESMVKF